MRIGRRGWCFRRPPPKQPKRRTSFNTSNYYMTKKSFSKPNYAFHVPGAPLNTTSYLVKTKEITNHCHYHHQQQQQQQQQNTMKNNEYLPSDSPVLDGYGSMKGLMGLSSSSLSLLIHKGEEETSGLGESDSPSKRVVRERVILGSKYGPPSPSRLLSLRIMHRDDQIVNLKEDSIMMKERVSSMERELDQLKHRVKVLEEEEVAQNAAMRSSVVMIRDCCYCGDAVSVA